MHQTHGTSFVPPIYSKAIEERILPPRVAPSLDLHYGTAIEDIVDSAAMMTRIVPMRGGFPYDWALYVNPSDSLKSLTAAPDLAGSRVLSVGGSGDFLLSFVNHGCAHICIRDISFPACSFNELKIQALSVLGRDEYWQLFGGIYGGNPRGDPLFDPTLYRRVAPLLSDHARTYFDCILTPGFEPLRIVRRTQIAPADSPEFYRQHHGLLRFRSYSEGVPDPQIGRYPFLQDDAAYEGLRTKLRQTHIRIEQGDLALCARSYFGRFDLVYLSNALGADPERSVGRIWSRVAPRVGVTLPQSSTELLNGIRIPARTLSGRGPSAIIGFDSGPTYGTYAEYHNKPT